MKQLSDVQQPFLDVCSIVEKILEKTEVKIANLDKEKYLKLLNHTATFAEHQIGIPITGNRPYTRDWKDNRIDDWQIEINLLIDIYIVLGAHILSFYDGDNSQDCCISSISHFRKSLALLKPWVIQMDLRVTDRTIVLTKDMIDYVREKLLKTHHAISKNYTILEDWDNAQHHLEQLILYTRQLEEGPLKTDRLYNALWGLSLVYLQTDRLAEAKTIREEAYMCVSQAYSLEHPIVLEAGGQLVQSLVYTGDHDDADDAERFARICYESLIRPPLDPESYEAAGAALNLAIALCQYIKNGTNLDVNTIIDANLLAKKSVHIMRKIKGPLSGEVKAGLNVLVDNLLVANEGEETSILLNDFLNDAINFEGRDGENAGFAHCHLGYFHYRISHLFICIEAKRNRLQLSEFHFKEALRIHTNLYGADDLKTLDIVTQLSVVSMAHGSDVKIKVDSIELDGEIGSRPLTYRKKDSLN
jgi:hypothetical protein